MTTRAVEQVESWDSRPFEDGYRGLHDLAEADFTGVVAAGPARLCMLNGTAVGVLDGSIEDFEDATGTAYVAPSPALPLLALMQERNDEVRAKYYTEDTSISEVDDTLSQGGFSGYVELSENVLSGDYYVVYHAGRSMAVAWVGESSQLLTDDEAFDRADGEVGIYQVRPAEVDAIEIPEPAEPEPDPGESAGSGAGAAGDGTDDASAEPDRSDSPAAEPESGENESRDRSTGGAGRTPDADGTAVPPADSGDDSAGTGSASDAGPAASDEDPPATDPDPPSDPVADDGPPDEPNDEPSDRARQSADRPADRERTGDQRDSADHRDSADQRDTGDRRNSSEDREDREPTRSQGAADRRDRAGTAGEETHASARTRPAEGGRPERREGPDRDRGRRDESAAGTGTGQSTPSEPASGRGEESPRGPSEAATDAAAGSRAPQGGGQSDDRNGSTSASASGPGRLETYSIPSLDPGRTTERDSPESPEPEAVPADPAPTGAEPSPSREGTPDRPGADRPDEPAGAEPRDRREPDPEPQSEAPARESGPEPEPAESEPAADVERLETELAALREERDELAAERDELEGQLESVRRERDDLETERDELREEVERLESEIDRLQTQLDRLEEEYGAATEADRRMGSGEALDQTNVFVRYESKGEATLAAARDGNAGREDVNANLDLEFHTQFDAERVSVGGRRFEEFFEETLQHRFVTWIVEDLLYEIRDTGKVAELEELYEAIPRIDRAELNGTIATRYREEGQDRRSQETFDVVMRDRMGDPLIVANFNDSRQAATESMMSSLVTASSHVGETTETLAASMLVTSSFFEPEALETAAEATSGGLLSRDKRASYVKLTRKQGYHLCLAEAREGQFHLAVPEL